MAIDTHLTPCADNWCQICIHTDRGEALRQAMLAVRKGGTLSMLGVYGVMDKFPIGVLMNKGITLRTAQQHGQRYIPKLFELVQNSKLDPACLATHRFALEDAALAYDMFKHKVNGMIRAIIQPN
ncbi:MAG TPA: hypothetical protein VJV78_43140 [Polyangiales bacterium]|nr:hypothetical protein [Polyangiales bacterium]